MEEMSFGIIKIGNDICKNDSNKSLNLYSIYFIKNDLENYLVRLLLQIVKVKTTQNNTKRHKNKIYKDVNSFSCYFISKLSC
jgi:hypothetical protein